jgi:hypothetical protein
MLNIKKQGVYVKKQGKIYSFEKLDSSMQYEQ